jgi:hypothetical protein
MTPVDEDWRSWRLRRWWMMGNIIVEAGLVIAIAILAWKSETYNGIRTVKYTPLTSLSHISWEKAWASQLWWTLLPALTMALVGICYSTMVAATAERQPFVELNHHEQDANVKNAKLTILLDYPSCALFYSWAVAFLNGHLRLGFAMLVQLVVSVSLVSLAGNLFRANASQSSSPVPLDSLVAFDVSQLKTSTDLQPAIDIANAIHLYGAAPPAWMTTSHAIEPFSPVQQDVLGNISVDTSVYSASFNCNIIDRSDLNMTFIPRGVASLGEEAIAFIDRGCDVVNQGFPVSSAYTTYAVSWYQDCPLLGLSNWDDRLGVFLGVYSATDPTRLANFITISCIPSYHNASASVKMSFATNGQPQVISISPNATHEMLQQNFEALHSSLHQYTTFDVSGTYKSDAFGRSVHTLAQMLSESSTLDPESALNATETVYATLFAALAETQLMYTQQSPKSMTGNLTSAITRLYVVVPIACAMLALLFLMWICSIGIFTQTYTTTSILKEDPVGLLGRAVVLLQSDIFAFISDVLKDNPAQMEVVKLVKDKYTVKESICFFDHDEAAASKIVQIKGLKPKLAQPPSRVARMKSWFAKKWRSRRENTAIRLQPANNASVATQSSVPNVDNAPVPNESLAAAIPPATDPAQASDHVATVNRASTTSGYVARNCSNRTQNNLPSISRHRTT